MADTAGQPPTVDGRVRVDAWFSAEGTTVGEGRAWLQVRFNRVPTGRGLMAVALDPDRFQAHADHRDAAIADASALGVARKIA